MRTERQSPAGFAVPVFAVPGIVSRADPELYCLAGVWQRRGPWGVVRFLIGGTRRAFRKLQTAALPGLAARRRRDDYRRLFAALDRHRVLYLTLGGTGMVLNGLLRPVQDIDLLLEATPENVARTLAAVRAGGFVQTPNVDADDILRWEATYFSEHIQLDLLTATRGLCFADAWERRRICSWEGVPAIAAEPLDIVANKNAYRRPKDRCDIDALLGLGLGL